MSECCVMYQEGHNMTPFTNFDNLTMLIVILTAVMASEHHLFKDTSHYFWFSVISIWRDSFNSFKAGPHPKQYYNIDVNKILLFKNSIVLGVRPGNCKSSRKCNGWLLSVISTSNYCPDLLCSTHKMMSCHCWNRFAMFSLTSQWTSSNLSSNPLLPDLAGGPAARVLCLKLPIRSHTRKAFFFFFSLNGIYEIPFWPHSPSQLLLLALSEPSQFRLGFFTWFVQDSSFVS